MSSVSGKYIMPNNAKYLRINLDKDTSNYLITKKYDKKQISTTLRSLPTGVKDTIEKRGNKYVKVQRCGEITLSGNESWNLWGLPSQNICKFYITVSGTKPSLLYTDVPNIYCSHFKQRPQSDMHEGTSNVEGVAVGHSHFQEVIVCIDKNKLSTQDIEGFKTWLRANPITVVYELETPIVTELPNFNPQTYSDSTTLLLNSGVVQGECSFEVTNSMGSEIEVLKDKVSGLDDYVKTEEVYYPTLLNGFEVAYPDVDINYIRKAGNMCFMYLSIKNISDVERGTVILRLPTHLRPKNLKRVLGMIDYLNHSIIVYGDGRITLSKQGSVNIANKELRVECWWEVE